MLPISARSAHWLYMKMDEVLVMSAVALQTPVLMPRDWFHCQHHLGFRFVLKSEDCIFGCVGGTAGKPTSLGTTLWPFFPRNLTKLDKMDISAYLMSFFSVLILTNNKNLVQTS